MAKKNQNDKSYTAYQYLAKEVKNANRRLNRIADTWGVESNTYKQAVKKMKEAFGSTFWYEVPKGKKSAGQQQLSMKAIGKELKQYQAEYGEVNTWNKIHDFKLKTPKTVGELKSNAIENLSEFGLNASAVTKQQAIEHVENLSYIQLELDNVISNYYELEKILRDEQRLLEDNGQYISDEVKNAYNKLQDLLNNGSRNEKGQLSDTEQIQDAIDTFKGVLKEVSRLKQVSRDSKKALADRIKEEQAKRGYGRDYRMKK